MAKALKDVVCDAYAYVDWNKPFDFISLPNDWELGRLYQELQIRSVPCVSNRHMTSDSTTTAYMFFSVNPLYVVDGRKEVGNTYSAHHILCIGDKVCSLQVCAVNEVALQSLKGGTKVEEPEYVMDDEGTAETVDAEPADAKEVNPRLLLTSGRLQEAKEAYELAPNRKMAEACAELIKAKQAFQDMMCEADVALSEEQLDRLCQIRELYRSYGVPFPQLDKVLARYGL